MVVGIANLVLAFALVAASLAAEAQPASPTARVGGLVNLPPPPDPVAVGFLAALREGLKEVLLRADQVIE